ncbi:hypothetical protein MNBD_ACTINO02-2830, partial [hydrothermal vent metagenome]
LIGILIAMQLVVPVPAENRVRPGTAIHDIIARTGIDHVVATQATDHVRARSTHQDVITLGTRDRATRHRDFRRASPTAPTGVTANTDDASTTDRKEKNRLITKPHTLRTPPPASSYQRHYHRITCRRGDATTIFRELHRM